MSTLSAGGTKSSGAGAIRHYCTFWVESLYLGVESIRVQEVVRHIPTTRVPLAPPAAKGLINLRGQIVLTVDLRTRLGLSPRDETLLPTNVVVQTDDGVVSLLVDDIDDVLDLDDSVFEATPSTLTAHLRALLLGVCKLEKRLLLVLDIDKVSQLED
ncbi:MAG: chemotaxis protein CheW [Candidatus Schekmanbacteria bacterium]|nr:chemotaxis protein CheW [Candidatus Schekmanbacteria bacterium]